MPDAYMVAYIGLGSNLGHLGRTPMQLVEDAVASLDSIGLLVTRSALYRTQPVGYAPQPAFINAAAAVETNEEPQMILHKLLQIEKRLGRDRTNSIRNGPRTLDLDLLLLDQFVLHTSDLTLPHSRLAERRFVLQPLAEIAPDLLHPVLRKSMRQLLLELPDTGENRIDAVTRL